VRKGGLAESRRTREQNVIQRLSPLPCRGDENAKIVDNVFLTDEILEAHRTQGLFDVLIVIPLIGCRQVMFPLFLHAGVPLMFVNGIGDRRGTDQRW
jgi:hypothetical protein